MASFIAGAAGVMVPYHRPAAGRRQARPTGRGSRSELHWLPYQKPIRVHHWPTCELVTQAGISRLGPGGGDIPGAVARPRLPGRHNASGHYS